MKVALLKFASSLVMGMVDDDDAAFLDDEFGVRGRAAVWGTEPGAGSNGAESGAGAEAAVVRLHYPATIETGSWFQQASEIVTAGTPGQQFVAMRFPVLLEVSRLSCDLGAAEGAEVFAVADSTTAIISAAGVEPAGERLQSSEGLVKKYLHALETIGVKAKRLPSGRQKVPRE